jgi:hypothetical protein
MNLDGNYYRCIITDGPCTEFSEVATLSVSPNGVRESVASQVKIYPNPADDMLNIKINEGLIGSSYSIYDETGRLIASGKLNSMISQLDVSGFAAGFYALVTDTATQPTVRFMVK